MNYMSLPPFDTDWQFKQNRTETSNSKHLVQTFHVEFELIYFRNNIICKKRIH